MSLELKIRKVVVSIDSTLWEGEKKLETPWTLATAAAVVKNPYVGVYQQDLSDMVDSYCTPVADLLLNKIREATGWDLKDCEAVGKAAATGLAGELEHGSAIIHSRQFGNPCREAVGGTAPLVGAELRVAPGSTIWIPLKHKNDHLVRSHHMSTSISILDAPAADEIVVAVSVCKSGRPLARIGSPKTDKV